MSLDRIEYLVGLLQIELKYFLGKESPSLREIILDVRNKVNPLCLNEIIEEIGLTILEFMDYPWHIQALAATNRMWYKRVSKWVEMRLAKYTFPVKGPPFRKYFVARMLFCRDIHSFITHYKEFYFGVCKFKHERFLGMYQAIETTIAIIMKMKHRGFHKSYTVMWNMLRCVICKANLRGRTKLELNKCLENIAPGFTAEVVTSIGTRKTIFIKKVPLRREKYPIPAYLNPKFDEILKIVESRLEIKLEKHIPDLANFPGFD